MLTGQADLGRLAASAPRIPAFHPEPIVLREVAAFQMTAEMHREAGMRALPPALHPTQPAALSVQAFDVADGPFGAFAFAVARVTCRSGVRARGFTAGAYATTAEAVTGLRETFGFPCREGDVRLRRHYDGVDLSVHAGDEEILRVHGLDPDPMGLDDVQYTSTMNLAETPNGLRLVQVESRHQAGRVERLQADLLGFDAAAWGEPALDPYYVIAASIALEEEMTLPAVRFVCKADELAFTGTEAVA